MSYGRDLTRSQIDTSFRPHQGRGPAELLLSWPAASAHVRTKQMASVLFVVALTAAGAQISFPLPFTPVPFTLQPLVVLIGGAALGRRLGMCAQIGYLMAGIAGLPVFAASADLPPGLGRLLGPTGGYLMAYPVAAYVTGALAERGFDRRYLTSLVAMTAGLAIIFAAGVLWLSRFVPGGFAGALAAGLYPFIGVDVVKILAGAAVAPALWRFLSPRD
jgi:biotin transport system substrate-specific component